MKTNRIATIAKLVLTALPALALALPSSVSHAAGVQYQAGTPPALGLPYAVFSVSPAFPGTPTTFDFTRWELVNGTVKNLGTSTRVWSVAVPVPYKLPGVIINDISMTASCSVGSSVAMSVIRRSGAVAYVSGLSACGGPNTGAGVGSTPITINELAFQTAATFYLAPNGVAYGTNVVAGN